LISGERGEEEERRKGGADVPAIYQRAKNA
jgi:hypothetical protein